MLLDIMGRKGTFHFSCLAPMFLLAPVSILIEMLSNFYMIYQGCLRITKMSS